MEPRYTPTWESNNEVLIGYAGKLDVYFQKQDDLAYAYIVGPDTRLVRTDAYNWDAFGIFDGHLEPPDPENHDVHIELHEMCDLYKLLIDFGYLKEHASGLQE
jgi:hypothetical protein